jgi:Domain of unknown function (DUF927)
LSVSQDTHQGRGRYPRPGGRPALADASKLRRPAAPTSAATQQLGPRLWRVPMSSGIWAISTDESPGAPLPRGLYQQEKDPAAEPGDPAGVRYAFRAALPYPHSRIVRRDGSGRQTTTDYLISAEHDGPRSVVTHHQVRSGEWAGALGVPLSDDPKIVAAAGTAIRYMEPADADYTEREAVPRVGRDGRVMIPAPETLPAGYLTVGPLDRAEALRQWAQVIVPVAAANPDFALVLAASAVSPFVGYLDHADCRAFIIDLAGEPNAGKSTTSRSAGAIWGAVPKDGTGVVGPWNMSAQGPGRALGMLGILPAFFDEQGVAGFGPDQFARTILAITDGSRRAADRSDGLRVSLPYSGVVVSAGNASIAAGLGAGRYAGIGPKRVNTLNGPFTSSADQAESVKPVLRDAHGHPGQVILEKFTGPRVAALVEDARKLVGLPAGIVARSAAKNMHLLVAGAAMLDEVFGTGMTIRDSAVKGALAYLAANNQDPEHDADRTLSLLRESMASQPARWPTVAEYAEHRRPRPDYDSDGHRDPARTELPQHGVDRDVTGVRANDGSWFAVFGEHLDTMLTGAGADRSIALAEADRRSWLHRTATDRHAGKMSTFVKGMGRMIRFDLPAGDDHQDQEAELAPDLPPGCPECDCTLPLHSPQCSQFDARLYGDDGQDQAAAAPEPATSQAPADEVPFAPFAAEVRDYIAECAASRVPPSADGAVKTIGHRGNAEAAMIRAAYADTAHGPQSPAPAVDPVALAELPGVGGPAPEPAPAAASPVVSAPELADPADDDEFPAFANEVRLSYPDAADADIAAALAVFHEIYGLRFIRSASWTGINMLRRDVALFRSKTAPTERTSPVLAEIAEAGPLRHIAFTVPGHKVRTGLHFTAWDINGQHPAAAGSTVLGTGEPELAARPRHLAPFLNGAGYVQLAQRVTTGHPAYGTIAKGDWVTMPHAKFMAAELGLELPAAQVVYWTGAGHASKHLATFTGRYRKAREVLRGREDLPGIYARAVAKGVANKTIGMFRSETHNRTEFYLPDWYDQIVAQAEANTLRHFARIEKGGGGKPIGKCADGAWWVSGTERQRPEGLEESDQLGKWKLEKWGIVTPEIVSAYKDRSAGNLQSAIKAADTARREGGQL